MRKKLLITVFLIIISLITVSLLFIMHSAHQSYNKVPKEFKKYISHSSMHIEYKKITPFYGNNKLPMPDVHTQKEALEDVDIFKYLFTTSYSGFEYWKDHIVK